MANFRPARSGEGKRSVRAVGTSGSAVAPTIVEPDEDTGPAATDAAKALAAEHGIDLAGVTGTGADGRITKDDVAGHVAEDQPLEPVTDEADQG